MKNTGDFTCKTNSLKAKSECSINCHINKKSMCYITYPNLFHGCPLGNTSFYIDIFSLIFHFLGALVMRRSYHSATSLYVHRLGLTNNRNGMWKCLPFNRNEAIHYYKSATELQINRKKGNSFYSCLLRDRKFPDYSPYCII